MKDQTELAEPSIEPLQVFNESYFPTPFFYCDLPGSAALNGDLVKAIRAERAKDGEGIERSNIARLGSWHSKTDLHLRPEFVALKQQVDQVTSEISSRLRYDPSFRLGVDFMWAIVNPPGSANRSHIHPGSLWSGVYYVQAPKDAGRIFFVDPRTAHLMLSPRFDPKQERGRESWREVNFAPVPGRAVLFPSWLYHRVEPNLTDAEGDEADRICISFNLTQKRLKPSRHKSKQPDG